VRSSKRPVCLSLLAPCLAPTALISRSLQQPQQQPRQQPIIIKNLALLSLLVLAAAGLAQGASQFPASLRSARSDSSSGQNRRGRALCLPDSCSRMHAKPLTALPAAGRGCMERRTEMAGTVGTQQVCLLCHSPQVATSARTTVCAVPSRLLLPVPWRPGVAAALPRAKLWPRAFAPV
jgi:hypothetical protein